MPRYHRWGRRHSWPYYDPYYVADPIVIQTQVPQQPQQQVPQQMSSPMNNMYVLAAIFIVLMFAIYMMNKKQT
jgi:hypothetical protein